MDCPVMKSQTNTEPKNGFFSSQKTKKQTKKKGQCKKLPKLLNQTPQSSSPQTEVIQSNSLQIWHARTWLHVQTCTRIVEIHVSWQLPHFTALLWKKCISMWFSFQHGTMTLTEINLLGASPKNLFDNYEVMYIVRS